MIIMCHRMYVCTWGDVLAQKTYQWLHSHDVAMEALMVAPQGSISPEQDATSARTCRRLQLRSAWLCGPWMVPRSSCDVGIPCLDVIRVPFCCVQYAVCISGISTAYICIVGTCYELADIPCLTISRRRWRTVQRSYSADGDTKHRLSSAGNV